MWQTKEMVNTSICDVLCVLHEGRLTLICQNVNLVEMISYLVVECIFHMYSFKVSMPCVTFSAIQTLDYQCLTLYLKLNTLLS